MSTATDTATPDPLAAEIGRLATYDVPVSIDVARAARDGRRHVNRRRVRVGAAVALSGAAAVTAGAVAWPLTGPQQGRDSGTDVVDSPTAPTTGTEAGWTWSEQPIEQDTPPRPSTPVQELQEVGIQTSWLSGGSFTQDSSASMSWAGPVLHEDRAGYLEFGVRRLGDDPCDLQVAPPDATGRTCRQVPGELGTAAVIEFADSEQGPMRLVVVEHAGYTAFVAYSLGFPVTDRETYDPNAIHWSGRGPYENSTASAPPLTSMPTSLEVQLSFAWSQLGSTGS